tara:strand:+ start:215 stop:430 length:216 start_codon:yes stop_codon:yes gene_type:complete
MGILNKLQTEGSNLSEFDGTTPSVTNEDTVQSTLHDTYSLNGNPTLSGYPSPSQLDLNGDTPSKYLDNLPE